MAIKQDIIDELLTDYKNPEDLLGEDGIFKELKKALLERALSAELSDHLGYEKLFKSLEVGLLQIIGKRINPPPKPHEGNQLDEDLWQQMDLLLPK